jgi:hypothetical protein
VFILDSLFIGGLDSYSTRSWPRRCELQDDGGLREELLEAQMRLELGELSDEEFVRSKRDVLARNPRNQRRAGRRVDDVRFR